MNKLSYRIVYNASRGQLMAVSEASPSDHGGTPSDQGNTVGVRQAAGQPLVTRPLSWAMWLALGMVSVVGSAQAGPTQIVVDPNAAAAHWPTVGTGVNGNGTVVNIQTPSAAGVSRNVYKQFDVGAEGVVLNNSRVGQRTQVAGPVAGNRSLVKGTAKVILNEVNGPAGSQLNGTVEVSGDRAQVIIANPAGVTCDGCGFINAKRVTLTTGTPVVNGGSLEGYRVEQGTTKIGPGGMNTGSADYTDIISRAVVVDGKVQARELRVITGANEVSADGSRITPIEGKGPKPEYAIDSSELGGMYAQKITLISTEAGVGVRRAGNLGASAGDVRISADGSILGSGVIQSAGDVVIAAQNIAQSGSIQARGNVRLSSRNKLEVGSGVIVSKGNTTLEAPVMTVSSDALLVAGMNDDGSVFGSSQLMVSGGSFQSKGKHVVAADFDIQAKTVDLADSTSQVGMSLVINAEGSLTTDRAKVLADQLLLAAWVLSNRGG